MRRTNEDFTTWTYMVTVPQTEKGIEYANELETELKQNKENYVRNEDTAYITLKWMIRVPIDQIEEAKANADD